MSGWITKTTGRPNFKTIELGCTGCGYHEERTVDCRELSDEQIELDMNPQIKCPNCEEQDLERMWLTAPSIGKLGKTGSDTQIAAMKKSYNDRFMKKEADDIRNKHGRAFDESLRGGAAQRIKKELGQ